MTVVSLCPRAFTRRTQKPFSSLWKVTRSISPEISTAVGLCSVLAALMSGDSFCHGCQGTRRTANTHEERVYNLGSGSDRRKMKLTLKARINRSDAETIRQALDELAAKGLVKQQGDEFIVEVQMEGASAKELNRTLLSALRKVEKRTTLRAEWTSGDTTERFFDYVPKKTVTG
jgi:hypothetical protein